MYEPTVELEPCSGIWNLVCVSILAVVAGAGILRGCVLIEASDALGLNDGWRVRGVEARVVAMEILRAMRGREVRAERARVCCCTSSIWVAISDSSQTNDTNLFLSFWKRSNDKDTSLEFPSSLCRTPWLMVPFQHCSALSRWGEKEYL